MSKTLWHTIKIAVPEEMVNITKKDKVVVKKSLTKNNNISKSNKEPSIKLISSDINKPKIISDGKEWNVDELKIKMKKSKDLGKKNEGKEFKKPSMRLESNVGMVKGNKVAHNYAQNVKFKSEFKKQFLESRNAKGVKWVDILDMYSKNDLIDWYNENIIKNKTINHKTIWKKKDKTKYIEEIPKYFNETTKGNIIKWLLERDLFPFYHTYKNKSEYKKLESKVDKSILNKERVFISGYDVILFYDNPGISTSLDFQAKTLNLYLVFYNNRYEFK